ncbi:hypothetical protein ACRARG_01295 [Pseudooceanicola sp. C21-150M6]|uniref:hypothetical protein n=1 Tax=Pseudooceanicola sp. C21-150M6 TaxID=3434355 RepID=UPI003D7F69B4
MTGTEPDGSGFNLMIVGQSGRLQYEAVLFAASLAANSPGVARLFVAEPQPGPRWPGNPVMDAPVREMLEDLGATILPFQNRHFGKDYPYGNKIEALLALPKGEPFVFFDSDTLVLDSLARVPFDFDRPSASLRVEGTWPKIELYGPGYTQTWKALYDKFALDFDSSLDLSQPDEYWRRYLYFNAGFFYYKCPHQFGQRFLDYALAIRDDGPEELVCQTLDPWLDQVALPLVIHSFGGGRDVLPPGLLDGEVTCHYRLLPLLYARESDRVVEVLESVAAPNKVKKLLKTYDPIKKMVFHERGKKVRALFDRDNLPRKEQAIRNKIKREGFWVR